MANDQSRVDSPPSFTQVLPQVKTLQGQVQGQISLAVMASDGAWLWHYQGQTSVALMSTFKPFACAKLLNDFEQGRVSKEHKVMVEADTLQAYSPVAKDWLNQAVSYQQACEATLRTSDNTAANIVLEGIGGPQGLTGFFRDIGDNRSRLDDIEPKLNQVALGETNNTSHAIALVQSLQRLTFGRVLTTGSQEQLLTWMKANQVSDNLLRASLPEGWRIADRSGAGKQGDRGIIAVVWPDNTGGYSQPVIMAIYIQHAKADMAQLDQAIAAIGASLFNVMLN
ncbi:class A beta-lactamase [Motilimonas pumila]|nr:class A beta-lactamase [Motilimonas pumila]